MRFKRYEKTEEGYQVQMDGVVSYDIVYDTKSKMNTLDLYLPKIRTQPFPLVMFIHGGGFAKGDKSRHLGGVLQALQRGYAVASVNYRLNEEAKFPACIQDVCKALRFLKNNANEYHIDRDRVVVWGDTHGGYIASKLAIEGYKGFIEEEQEACEILRVQGVISFYAPIDYYAYYEKQMKQNEYSCINGFVCDELTFGKRGEELLDYLASIDMCSNLDGSEPPFYLLHGCLDHQISHEHTKRFAKALASAQVKHNVVWVPDGIHGIDFYDRECDNGPIMKFIDECFLK